MSLEYQRRDAHFLDYRLYRLPGVSTCFRGPRLTSDRYIVCTGAAQTFGRFVPVPFPALLSVRLGIEALNLGRGSAGPTFPQSHPILMEHINRAQLAIVQVVSGRSTSNSLFRVKDHSMVGTSLVDGRDMTAEDFFDQLLKRDLSLTRNIVAETRENYVDAMKELLGSIHVPKILFWFSVRPPEYKERWGAHADGIFGEFPQLVNREMINQLLPHCQSYVECVSRTGLPQPIPQRDPIETAKLKLPKQLPRVEITGMNEYYPSPEMHAEAAALLETVCHRILGK